MNARHWVTAGLTMTLLCVIGCIRTHNELAFVAYALSLGGFVGLMTHGIDLWVERLASRG